MKSLSPIVLFVYNRPSHTKKTVNALQRNEFASQSQLIIYSDAPKNENDIQKVNEVREYIKTINGFKDIQFVTQTKNIGLAKSISEGISHVVNTYGRVIVLEDDIVTSPFFLMYMNDALDFYLHEERVMQISGYMYPINTEKLKRTFFLNKTSCWGWATWKRAWSCYRKDSDYLLKSFNRKMIKCFNVDNSIDLFSQIKMNKKGRINTWAIYWDACVFLEKGLVLYPKVSFVNNIGHDGSGAHCNKNNLFDTVIVSNYDIEFSNQIEESLEAKNALIPYFKSFNPGFLKKILNRLKRIF